jgi:hypothetical protein
MDASAGLEKKIGRKSRMKWYWAIARRSGMAINDFRREELREIAGRNPSSQGIGDRLLQLDGGHRKLVHKQQADRFGDDDGYG